jgi:hypothetical protein
MRFQKPNFVAFIVLESGAEAEGLLLGPEAH